MTASKQSTGRDLAADNKPPDAELPADDAPDLSTDEWRRRLDQAPVRRGRPRASNPKVSTTIRLDADIVETFRAQGPGWQSRMNRALREWLAKAG